MWFQNRRQREKAPEDMQMEPASAESELQQSLERYPSFGRDAFSAPSNGAFGSGKCVKEQSLGTNIANDLPGPDSN